MYSNRIACSYRFVTTQFGFPPPASKAPEHLDSMAAMGFPNVELMGVGPAHLEALAEYRDTFKSKVKEAKMRIPFTSILLPGLSDPKRPNRESSLDAFSKACVLAEQLNALSIVDYGPLPPVEYPNNISEIEKYNSTLLASAPIPSRLNWFDYWEGLVDTYRQVCDLAAQHNLNFCLRPTFGGLVSNTDAFLYFHEEVGRSNLRFAIDTANQFAVRDNPILSAIRLRDLLDVVYLADSNGNEDEHLEPGEGSIRWDLFFDTLQHTRFRGYIALDIGGSKSEINDLPGAYKIAASMVESFIG